MGGLQFIKLDGIQTEADKYLQKISCFTFCKQLKYTVFWAYEFKISKKKGLCGRRFGLRPLSWSWIVLLIITYKRGGVACRQSCESRRQKNSTCSRPRFREIWKVSSLSRSLPLSGKKVSPRPRPRFGFLRPPHAENEPSFGVRGSRPPPPPLRGEAGLGPLL